MNQTLRFIVVVITLLAFDQKADGKKIESFAKINESHLTVIRLFLFGTRIFLDLFSLPRTPVKQKNVVKINNISVVFDSKVIIKYVLLSLDF